MRIFIIILFSAACIYLFALGLMSQKENKTSYLENVAKTNKETKISPNSVEVKQTSDSQPKEIKEQKSLKEIPKTEKKSETLSPEQLPINEEVVQIETKPNEEKALPIKEFNKLDFIPNILYSKGTLDGKSFSSKADIVNILNIKSFEEFPNSIVSGQKIVCSLEFLKEENYELVVHFDKKWKERKFAPWSSSDKPNFIHIRFNNDLIYTKWTALNREPISCLIPSTKVSNLNNYITIHNESEEEIFLDTIFLKTISNEDRCTLSVTNAGWIAADYVPDIKNHSSYAPNLLQASIDKLNEASLNGKMFWEVKLDDDQDNYELQVLNSNIKEIVKRDGRLTLILHKSSNFWIIRALKNIVDAVTINELYNQEIYEKLKKEFPEISIHFTKERFVENNLVKDSFVKLIRDTLRKNRIDDPTYSLNFSSVYNFEEQGKMSWKFFYETVTAFSKGFRHITMDDISLGSSYFPIHSHSPSFLFQNVTRLTKLFDKAHHIPHNLTTYDAGFGLLDTESFSFKDQNGIINLLIVSYYDINRNISFQISCDEKVNYKEEIEVFSFNGKFLTKETPVLSFNKTKNILSGTTSLKNLNIIRFLPTNYKEKKANFVSRVQPYFEEKQILKRITSNSEVGPSLIHDVIFEMKHGKPEHVSYSKIPASNFKDEWKEIPNNIPFQNESYLLDFKAPGFFRIPVTSLHGEPDKVQIWLRPNQDITISLAVTKVFQNINLYQNKWNCIELPYKNLLKFYNTGYSALTIISSKPCQIELNDIVGVFDNGSESFDKGVVSLKENKIFVSTLPTAQKNIFSVLRLKTNLNFNLTCSTSTNFEYKYNKDSGILYLTFKNKNPKSSDTKNFFEFTIEEVK